LSLIFLFYGSMLLVEQISAGNTSFACFD